MKHIVAFLFAARASATGCTADEDCYQTSEWRCVESKVGSRCVLDRAYNTTGLCSCGTQSCTNLSAPPPKAAAKQYLVIGDSISEGYFGTLKSLLERNGSWEVFHTPGNSDNTNWGLRCLGGWLGPDPKRWDAISMNWGLHDLAFPDNEHLDVDTYSDLLVKINIQIASLVRPDTKVFWVTTTPVPTNPPPDPTGKSCELIPGRVEPNVLRYNAAATKVMQGLPTCDLHKVITDYCGIGYSTCNISQCGGPHYTGDGFPMLGRAMAQCVSSALRDERIVV